MSRREGLKTTPQTGARTSVASSRGRKRIAKIVQAAKTQFLEGGYHATSIDTIVKHAGGSKSTLYGDFSSKAALFRAVVQSILTSADEPQLDRSNDIGTTLLKFSEYRMKIASSAENVALVRLVLAEQQRFPDVAKTYWEEGPQRRQDALCEYFRTLAAHGDLKLENPRVAANRFVALLMQPWYMRLLYIPTTAPSALARRKHANEIIALFLDLYEGNRTPSQTKDRNPRSRQKRRGSRVRE